VIATYAGRPGDLCTKGSEGLDEDSGLNCPAKVLISRSHVSKTA